jgi:LmbE family N-acetylglucosaminyl deacetylase
MNTNNVRHAAMKIFGLWICVLLAIFIPAVSHAKWNFIAGKLAQDISVGKNGTIYMIDTTVNVGGGRIYKWANGAWGEIGGTATHIDVDDNGLPWVVNDGGAVFQRNASDTAWNFLPGLAARDIGVGPAGIAYAIGKDSIGNNNGRIYKWAGNVWQEIGGLANRIDIDNRGLPWIVNSSGAIFRRNDANTAWETISGPSARDIGTGADGSVFVTGKDPVVGGGRIYKWSGNAWGEIGGTSTQISVDGIGRPLVINERGEIFFWEDLGWNVLALGGINQPLTQIAASASTEQLWAIDATEQIWRRSGSTWSLQPGQATKIAISHDGTVWAVNRYGSIFKWNGNGWAQIPGECVEISAGNNGRIVVVNSLGLVFNWNGSLWSQLPGVMKKAVAAPNNETWAIDSNGVIYRLINGAWIIVPGEATDITVGADGAIVTTNSVNQSIWTWTGFEWDRIPGLADKVALANAGRLIALDTKSGNLRELRNRSPGQADKSDLLVVHAHPDDEGIHGGGVLAYYAQYLRMKVTDLVMVSRNSDGTAPLVSTSLSRMAELRSAMDIYAGNNAHGVAIPALISAQGEIQGPEYHTGNITLVEGGFVDTGAHLNTTATTWSPGLNGLSWGGAPAVTQLTPNYGNWLLWGDARYSAAYVIAREIRRRRPDILVSVHSFEGDYGHSNHIATAIAVVEGERMAADSSQYIDSLPAWQVKKVYARGTKEQNFFKGGVQSAGQITWGTFQPQLSSISLFHDFFETQFNDTLQSSRMITARGLEEHKSQQIHLVPDTAPCVASVFEAGCTYFNTWARSEWWTLYLSRVGNDSLESFMVPGDLIRISYPFWARGNFLEHIP